MQASIEVRYSTTEVGSVGGINTSSQVFFSNITTASGGTGSYYSGDTQIVPNGGNLGLGVTPSAWSQGKAFEIGSAGYGLWYGSGSPSSTYLLNNVYYNSGFKYAGTGQAAHYYQYLGQHVWSTAPSGTAGNAVTFTQAMTLDASGNLLVGTTSSNGDRFQAESQSTATNYRCATFRSVAAGTGFSKTSIQLIKSASNYYGAEISGYIEQGVGAGLILSTINDNSGVGTSVERARIDYSGNLGIGTSSPGSTLDVRFATNPIVDNGVGLNAIRSYVSAALAADIGGAVTFGGTASSGGALASFGQIAGRKENATSANYAGYLQFVTNNSSGTMSERMRLDSSGNLGIGTTSPGAKLDIYVSRTSSTSAVALYLTDNVTGGQTDGVYKSIRSGSNNKNSISEIRFVESDGSNNNTSIAFATQSTAGGLTERMRITQSGALAFAGASNYGSSGQILQSNGNAAPTWVNASSITSGSASLTSTYVGFGSGSNTLTGSSNLTWNGSTLSVTGSIVATTKSFLITHPTKSGMKLRYGSLEGPENGVYVRGKLTNNNVIELPDYWTGLVDNETITVNLTSIGQYQKLYIKDISNNTVIVGIEDLSNHSINCFYTVWAERKDVDKLVVEF
jgi:hypothetical protein